MAEEINSPQNLNSSQTYDHNYEKCQQRVIKVMIFHFGFKCSLYLSVISLLGFMIFQITQIDIFFTIHYFSFTNWSAIICLSFILIVEAMCDIKLAKKIDELLFYSNSLLLDLKVLIQNGKALKELNAYEEDTWS